MAKSKKLELEDVLKRFDACTQYWGDIYKRGKEDTEFVAQAGKQWPDQVKKERMADGRPCLEENRLLPFVNQVLNQIRQSKPSIVPKPVDSEASSETAEICRGLIRNIEVISDGDTVYDTAARNSVMGAVGWIRVITDYADDDTFDQECLLERVINQESIYLDPNHKRQDGSDAEYGFAFEDMDIDEFKDKYPDATLEGWTKSGWLSQETVRVADYYYKSYDKSELVEWEIDTITGPVSGVTLRDKVPSGATEKRSRKVDVCTVKYAKMTGGEFLEGEKGERTFPGKYIPLIPVYGFEVWLNDKRDFFSLIHPAKDPQMMLNAWRSASYEVVAMQPKAPYVGAKGQFETYQAQWRDANRKNYPFLEYDPVVDDNGAPCPPPMRQPPPTPSPAMMQEAISAADAIKASLGMYDASMGQQTPDISGKAIISRQMQGDNATFHFVDNLSVAIRHVGRVLIGIIPLVYNKQRVIRILGDDGAETLVPLGKPVTKVGKAYQEDPNGQVIRLDAGKYDVVVEVGPAYATRRQELANALIEIARVNPAIMGVAGDLLIKALDVPQAEEIAKRIRATMDPSILADDVDAARIQMLTKSLNDLQTKLQLTEEALLAKKNNEEFKNSLEAKKIENDTKKLMIDAALAEAEIQKIQAEINQQAPGAMDAVSAVITDLQGKLDDVSGALHVLLSHEEGEATGEPESPDNESMSYAGQPDIGSAEQRA